MTRRRNPFDEIERVFDRMSDQFEGMGDAGQIKAGGISVDVAESTDEITITADLPGYENEDIDLSARDGRLTIRAQRESEVEQTEETYHRRERTHQQHSRTLSLPAEVDEEAAEATYRNGVLTVTLPKVGSTDQGHRIDVE